ncbi:LAFA_0F08438g1_1 [Lachancea sp. 'fantastica']|nr:LAFA_0F08438g1_1 [Lachancea sp. 'fantastica']
MLRTSNFVTANRSLHVSARRSDFMSWFKRKQDSESKKTVRDTKEVIADIESGESKTKSSNSKLKLSEDSFIGEEANAVHKAKLTALVAQVPFNNWLSSKKVTTAEALDQAILQALNGNKSGAVTSVTDDSLAVPFSDLITKFHFTKALQASTGVLVPDYQLTRLKTPLEFRSFYLKEVVSGKLAKYKDAEPNAIDLDNSSHAADTVHVVKPVAPKDQRKKLSNILSEVEALERQSAKEALESARQVV